MQTKTVGIVLVIIGILMMVYTGFNIVTKEKVVVKTDEAFQLNIEMIEDKGFDLLPSPLHFTDF